MCRTAPPPRIWQLSERRGGRKQTMPRRCWKLIEMFPIQRCQRHFERLTGWLTFSCKALAIKVIMLKVFQCQLIHVCQVGLDQSTLVEVLNCQNYCYLLSLPVLGSIGNFQQTPKQQTYFKLPLKLVSRRQQQQQYTRLRQGKQTNPNQSTDATRVAHALPTTTSCLRFDFCVKTLLN